MTFLAGAVIAAVAAALAAALVRSRNRELGGRGDAPAGH
ncbi:major facilitator family protein [Achromobacter ruhlandii]|nr:major facilitator family protein [Achromobacter ruhlandii]